MHHLHQGRHLVCSVHQSALVFRSRFFFGQKTLDGFFEGVSQFSEAFKTTKLSAKELREEELMLQNTARPEVREIQFYPDSWFSLWVCFLSVYFY